MTAGLLSKSSKVCLSLLLACLSLTPLSAEQFGRFTYEVIGNEVTITDYPVDATDPVVIPASIEGRPVTSIGDSAFRHCRMPKITIPGSVRHIERFAFYNSGLTSVYIPAGVINIRGNAFGRCLALHGIRVDDANLHYIDQDGVLFGLERTTLVIFPGGRGGSYTIPDSVTSIGETAFFYCESLTTISLPDSLTSIGSGAFWGCRRLTTINIPNRITGIGGATFSGCRNLTSITLPDKLNSIGPDAFKGCRSLRNINLPDHITLIGSGAFRACEELTSIILPDNLISIDRGAFLGCRSLVSISLPDSVNSIADSAFSNCLRLTSISLPKNLMSIGDFAFYACEELTSIILPNSLTSIGSNAFEDCRTLTTLTIPDSVTTIGSSMFWGCSSLTSITLPDGLTRIGYRAFHECRSLIGITIPGSVNSIGNSAFVSCRSLTSAVFLGDKPDLGRFIFTGVAPEFTIYYRSDRTGFTSPTMWGFPAVMLDLAETPATPWLLEHGFVPEIDLQQDLNGDGVSLLMAYALDLDPKRPLHRDLPTPLVEASSLSLTFRQARPDTVTYRVETSSDLQHWSDTGVTLSDPDPERQVTASLNRDAPRRYLRLVVNLDK